MPAGRALSGRVWSNGLGPLAADGVAAGLRGWRRAGGGSGGRQKPLLRASFRAIHGAQRPRTLHPPVALTVSGARQPRMKRKRRAEGDAGWPGAEGFGVWSNGLGPLAADGVAAGLRGWRRAGGGCGGRQKPLLRASFRAIHGAQRPRTLHPPVALTVSGARQPRMKRKRRVTGDARHPPLLLLLLLPLPLRPLARRCRPGGRLKPLRRTLGAPDGRKAGPMDGFTTCPAQGLQPPSLAATRRHPEK